MGRISRKVKEGETRVSERRGKREGRGKMEKRKIGRENWKETVIGKYEVDKYEV